MGRGKGFRVTTWKCLGHVAFWTCPRIGHQPIFGGLRFTLKEMAGEIPVQVGSQYCIASTYYTKWNGTY